MGSLFRSEDMTLCQLYLQADASYQVVSQLGEMGIVQFKDLNEDVNAFQKKFVNEVRRCEEMERQLRYFEREIKKDDLPILDAEHYPEAPAPRDMIDLEAQFEKHESELKELTANIDALKQNYTELNELKHVLRYTEDFFLEAVNDIELSTANLPQERQPYLGYVAGVIGRDKLPGFTRLLWFACRGNVFVRHVEIPVTLEDRNTGQQVHKSVLMVFFQGDQLKSKVKKICEGFKATLYPCPESVDERREMGLGVLSRLQDLEQVLSKSNEQKQRVLTSIASNLKTWYIKVLKIKAIYHTMNMFKTDTMNYVAECWLPTAEMGAVHLVMNRASESQGITAPSLLHPIESKHLPTYHKTNKFTYAFQTIINSYGVANYKEVNPAPFSIITFPFLFAVMFGDMGHGLILLVFALALLWKEQALDKIAKTNEIVAIIFGGRYIILLMSLFSVYTGLIYNDIFSKSINIFGSKWNVTYDQSTLTDNPHLQLNPNDTSVYPGTPYPFGMDPVWSLAGNKITWTNSFKEKMSVILGVSQMLLGIILSIFNHVHTRQYLNIFCEFIPQVMFLMCIFGYLNALIFHKWIVYNADQSYCAPNILIAFINMFLFSYPEGEDSPCYMHTWYPGQKYVQMTLVVVAVVCAAIMLLAKPLILRARHNRASKPLVSEGYREILSIEHGDLEGGASINTEAVDVDDTAAILPSNGVQSEEQPGPSEPKVTMIGEVEEFDFSETFLYQAIHTIEFCLGCISHTASYLRLWALSLAHSQLSEVLWNMVLRLGFKTPSYLGVAMIYPLFAFFAGATVVILLVMEGLSAFLHTLRLHWVEFMSKFYKGEGVLFAPFCFKEIIEENVS